MFGHGCHLQNNTTRYYLAREKKLRLKNYPPKGNNIFTISTEVQIIWINSGN